MHISEIMTANPVTVGLATSIGEAWDLLRKLNVRHLPVVNHDGELIGMIDERDFGFPGSSPLVGDILGSPRFYFDAPIARIMKPTPIAVDAHASVAEVVQLMVRNRIGAVPVVDSNGRMAGIVSYLDILENIDVGDEQDSLDAVLGPVGGGTAGEPFGTRVSERVAQTRM